jgi:hypothetical protein
VGMADLVPGMDDNQQWTTSRRRDAWSARGSDSCTRGLRRRAFPEPAYAPPRRRLLDAGDPANSGGCCLRPVRRDCFGAMRKRRTA